ARTGRGQPTSGRGAPPFSGSPPAIGAGSELAGPGGAQTATHITIASSIHGRDRGGSPRRAARREGSVGRKGVPHRPHLRLLPGFGYGRTWGRGPGAAPARRHRDPS